jgi:hypothetical protein
MTALSRPVRPTPAESVLLALAAWAERTVERGITRRALGADVRAGHRRAADERARDAAARIRAGILPR